VLTWPKGARSRAGATLGPLLTAVLAATLAGCGGSSGNGVASRSAPEILAASIAAADSAASVHVAGRSAQGQLALTLETDLATNGGHARVSVLGAAYELIRLGNILYLKGNSAFDTRVDSATGLHVPKGVWLRARAHSGPTAQLASFTDLSGELRRLLSNAYRITKGAATTVNGQRVIELKETGRLFSGSLYIAATGTPYPIELVKRGRETEHTTFSRWNVPVTLTAPRSAISIP
jgi:hypothetical protein